MTSILWVLSLSVGRDRDCSLCPPSQVLKRRQTDDRRVEPCLFWFEWIMSLVFVSLCGSLTDTRFSRRVNFIFGVKNNHVGCAPACTNHHLSACLLAIRTPLIHVLLTVLLVVAPYTSFSWDSAPVIPECAFDDSCAKLDERCVNDADCCDDFSYSYVLCCYEGGKRVLSSWRCIWSEQYRRSQRESRFEPWHSPSGFPILLPT